MSQSPTLIRATNPLGYRYNSSDPWGVIIGVVMMNQRPCYFIVFGALEAVAGSRLIYDYWPVYDPSDPYEFKASRDEV